MPASIGVNLRVTGHCSQGGRKYMEDLFSVAYQQTEDGRDLEYAYFGIYDGHGGSEAAAFAKEHLMESIVKQRQFWSDNDDDVLKAIRNGYMLTHLNMWRELEKWPKTVTGLPSTAGTTASVAFVRRGKIYIGHVGDSAIVLGYQNEGSDTWMAKPLTSDHKPESTIEMSRIQRCGGKVVSKAGVPRVVWNRPRPGHKGPIKKNTPMDEIPFLAVARSLGDLWSYNANNDEFIVSPDPDVGVLTIDPTKFRCLIFGTDGLWNMMLPEVAVSLVQATEKHNEATLVASAGGQPRDWLNPSKSLVDHALERWSNTRMRADNTSVVTLMLDPPGPPRATVVRSKTTPPVPVPAPPTPIAVTTTNTTNVTENKSEVPSDADRQVPENGLAIMTRFSDVDRPNQTTDTKTVLPRCNSIDGRLSMAPIEPQTEVDDGDDTITNYGNPAESFFMTRLLNRSRIVNTLSDVHEEINTNQIVTEVMENRDPSPPPVMLTNKSNVDVEFKSGVDNVKSSGGAESTTDIKGEESHDTNSPIDKHVDSCIQINEVSSSSPTDCPTKGRGKKSKDTKMEAAITTNGRVLRSHDIDTPQRPQTRQTAHRSKPPNSQPATLERVVILSRARGVPVNSAVLRINHSSSVTDTLTTPRRQIANDHSVTTPEVEGKINPGRAMRSRESSCVSPITQKITRSTSNGRPAETRIIQSIAKPGNSGRAPGQVRRPVPVARGDSSRECSKENCGASRRRPVVVRAPARPSRVRPVGSTEPEVPSTGTPPECRALRSRNVAEAGELPRATKRGPGEEHAAGGKAPRLVPLERRTVLRRAQGAWAPALALRNRLRKRLCK